MANCEFCDVAAKQEESETIYEDDKVVAVLNLKPAHPGQILLFTREHYPIIEQVPDYVVSHLFKTANRLSKAIFETLNIQGTNIIVQNGVAAGQSIPHFCINIVPRSENDGLNFQWQPKKISKEEADVAFLKMKGQTENLHPSQFEKEKKEKTLTVEEAPKKLDKKEEDYLVKQLRRIP